ncbi:hypothetical protein L1887_54570 [Cichorium endivia]|nr:hypothetical protein L1887_54570 [Cichorium endivia]
MLRGVENKHRSGDSRIEEKKAKSDSRSSGERNGSSLNRENGVVGEQYKRRAARRSRVKCPLEPRASWFSPKCVEAQQLTGHLGGKKGRENASSQCSSTRRYGAEVTHAILPGKARTAFNKRVPVPETDTGRTGQGTVSGRQFLWGVGLPKGNGGRAKVSSGRDGDWPSSAKAEGSLTARPTRRAGTKADLPPRAHIDGKVWHLDVGSSPPGAVVCSKGWAVRPLKAVRELGQNVVRQFGPYPVWALEH